MNQKQAETPALGISLADVYYVLFRRKWLILTMTFIGICAASWIYLFFPFPYSSEAKLYIRFVADTSTQADPNTTIQKPSGASVLNSELELITSWDVAKRAAEVVGPERILGKAGKSTNADSAALVITMNLLKNLPRDDNVITIRFTHNDPSVVQPVLSEIINAYKEKYKAIHLTNGTSVDALMAQAEEAKGRVDDAARQINEKMTKAGIVDLDDAKRQATELLGKLEGALVDSTAELSQCQASLEELHRMHPNTINTNNKATNLPALATPPPSKIAEYQMVCTTLGRLENDQAMMMQHLTTNSPLVQASQAGVDKARVQKETLEKQWPALVATAPSVVREVSNSNKLTPEEQMEAFLSKAAGWQARISTLTNDIMTAQAKISAVNELGASIAGLQRTKEVEETSYKAKLQAVDQAQTALVLSPGGVNNIGIVEAPTPPGREARKIAKSVITALFGCVGAGLVMAFLIELVLNRTFRHPRDVQATLGLPFFISVPKIKNGRSQLKGPGAGTKLALPMPTEAAVNGEGGEVPAAEGGGALVPAGENGANLRPWDPNYELHPFFEALRDRLISYFDAINLTHKPKLVAVTSCGTGAGVTTTAAGLAASLSETGDGNVLLVNMNVADGEAQHFYKGKLSCGLEDALEKDKRGEALHDNLYVAGEMTVNESLPRVLPKRFSNLVPKMKASDFDYIIFDMPPVTQISITPRLARFMDMVLMVVESNKTDRELARRAAGWLSENKANIGVILNKTRSYVPKGLQQDL